MREEPTEGTDLGQSDTTTRCIRRKAKKGDEACEKHQRERERSMESTSWRPNDCLNNLWMCDYGHARCIVGVLDGSIYTYVQQLNSKLLEMLPVAGQNHCAMLN